MSAECQQEFQRDLLSFRFREGELKGDWGLAEGAPAPWPHALLWIRTAERDSRTVRFYFRFDLTGYPKSAPSACLWNIDKGEVLDESKRPRDSSGAVLIEFRMPWNGYHALYVPWDRGGIQSHPDWTKTYPGRIWREGCTICDFLDWTWELLNADTYAGIKAT